MALAFNPVTNNYYYNTSAGAANNYYTGKAANNNSAGVSTYAQLVALQQAQATFSLTQNTSSVLGANTSSNDTSSLNTADLLNLSPAALNILNGIESANSNISTNGVNPFSYSIAGLLNVSGVSAITSGTTTDTLAVNGSLDRQTLTALQRSQVANIVSQYANRPVTQQTFNQIEAALTAAGLNPQQITLQQALGAYAIAYAPTFSFTGKLFTDTLSSELDNA